MNPPKLKHLVTLGLFSASAACFVTVWLEELYPGRTWVNCGPLSCVQDWWPWSMLSLEGAMIVGGLCYLAWGMFRLAGMDPIFGTDLEPVQ